MENSPLIGLFAEPAEGDVAVAIKSLSVYSKDLDLNLKSERPAVFVKVKASPASTPVGVVVSTDSRIKDAYATFGKVDLDELALGGSESLKRIARMQSVYSIKIQCMKIPPTYNDQISFTFRVAFDLARSIEERKGCVLFEIEGTETLEDLNAVRDFVWLQQLIYSMPIGTRIPCFAVKHLHANIKIELHRFCFPLRGLCIMNCKHVHLSVTAQVENLVIDINTELSVSDSLHLLQKERDLCKVLSIGLFSETFRENGNVVFSGNYTEQTAHLIMISDTAYESFRKLKDDFEEYRSVKVRKTGQGWDPREKIYLVLDKDDARDLIESKNLRIEDDESSEDSYSSESEYSGDSDAS